MTFFPELAFHQSGYNLRGRPRGRNDRLVKSKSLDALTRGTSVSPSEAEPKVCILFFSFGCSKGGRLLPRSDIAARHCRRGGEHKRGVPMNTASLIACEPIFLVLLRCHCHQSEGCFMVSTALSSVQGLLDGMYGSFAVSVGLVRSTRRATDTTEVRYLIR